MVIHRKGCNYLTIDGDLLSIEGGEENSGGGNWVGNHEEEDGKNAFVFKRALTRLLAILGICFFVQKLLIRLKSDVLSPKSPKFKYLISWKYVLF